MDKLAAGALIFGPCANVTCFEESVCEGVPGPGNLFQQPPSLRLPPLLSLLLVHWVCHAQVFLLRSAWPPQR